MSPSLRFLAVAVLGWVGIRSAMLGAIPGGELFALGKARPPAAPPVVATEFPPIEPLAPAPAATPPWLVASALRPPVQYYPVPAPYPVYREARWSEPSAPLVRPVAPAFYASVPVLDEWPLSRLAAASSSPLGMAPPLPQSFPQSSAPAQRVDSARFDRLQLTAWALLRGQGLTSSTNTLASGSALGGSQAGARLAYRFTPQVAATLRTTNTVGQRGGEVALGARVQPVRGLPLWVTAERRQRLGRYGGGRNAFALFFEGGLWDRPLPANFRLDAYFQGGVVGFKSRDAFIDGAVTATRPVYRNFSAGLGIWGGAQPGAYRVDAGPRVTMKVRENVKVHFDYRQRLAGNAEPGSGPAVTLAGDF